LQATQGASVGRNLISACSRGPRARLPLRSGDSLQKARPGEGGTAEGGLSRTKLGPKPAQPSARFYPKNLYPRSSPNRPTSGQSGGQLGPDLKGQEPVGRARRPQSRATETQTSAGAIPCRGPGIEATGISAKIEISWPFAGNPSDLMKENRQLKTRTLAIGPAFGVGPSLEGILSTSNRTIHRGWAVGPREVVDKNRGPPFVAGEFIPAQLTYAGQGTKGDVSEPRPGDQTNLVDEVRRYPTILAYQMDPKLIFESAWPGKLGPKLRMFCRKRRYKKLGIRL